MEPVHTFTVAPNLPESLKDMVPLASNLHWCWNHEAIGLFRRLDSDLWEETDHNPILMLGRIRQERLESAAADDAFLANLKRVKESFDAYMTAPTWFRKHYGEWEKPFIAYFCAEFGLTECLRNYSGGLGVLAGDHMKSASDLGLPLVGVGLLYQEGYFRQYLNIDGWQQERYPKNDFYSQPIHLVLGDDGQPVTIEVDLPDGTVKAQAWRIDVGRVCLIMLDCAIESNPPKFRNITSRLYGGDLEMRIRQEMVLGIGGLRMLWKLGIEPTVCHMNEGHSAFLGLERASRLIEEQGVTFQEALETVRAGTVFTTHTPVPAGNDVFPFEMVDRYFKDIRQKLGLDRNAFMELGMKQPGDEKQGFWMTVLALKLAEMSNGVSALHGVVSRAMWNDIWPDVPVHEAPIKSLTNGIHTASWVSHDMASLFDRYLGPDWAGLPSDTGTWQRIDRIPDDELWRTHQRRRERLIAFARDRLRAQLRHRGASSHEVEQANEILNPEALTIGFARRFATYKRATLLFTDIDRLKAILCNVDRPVQMIFAGKAHPHDTQGKELIRQIVHQSLDPDLRMHIVFLEDYDACIGRYMVQGCDLWLNTPRRPLEASGTSGMKVVPNGGINCSILDGWWDEAYTNDTGWAIGSGEEYEDEAYQDEVEVSALYNLFEKEIVPLFYVRDRNGLPRGWIAKMKSSMKAICPVFNTSRMVQEYAGRFYLPCQRRHDQLAANGLERSKALAAWKEKVQRGWQSLEIVDAGIERPDDLMVSSEMAVVARVKLGPLTPDDIEAQIYYSRVGSDGHMLDGDPITMNLTGIDDGVATFRGVIVCQRSGRFGFTVRVLPSHPDMMIKHEMGLVLWEKRALVGVAKK